MTGETGAELVDRYLQLCEDRDLEEAARLLAPDVRMVFPGGRVFASLPEMVAGAGGRYRWVRKRRERYFEGAAGDATVVTSLGTLYGEDLTGDPFSGVRYVDVFVIHDGLITEQNVYNDLTEAGIPFRPADASQPPS
ncbi:nuclear transport factor 2 family protein [Streptosporangium sp. NPDC004631]